MDSVGTWLQGLGLGQYAPAFEANHIDTGILADLSDQDLETLGVASLGHRKKILKAIAALPDSGGAAEGSAQRLPEFVPDAERHQLTVMFVDIVSSTTLSEGLDPEDFREVIRSFNDTSAKAIQRYGGHVARPLGDGLLVYFGYPVAREDDTARAIEASLATIEATADVRVPGGAPLGLRIGIATGGVVIGDLVGEHMSDSDTVLGDVPNLAARLQALAEPGTVVVSDATHRLTAGGFDFQDLGLQKIKGLARPAHTWRVLRAKPFESRFQARHEALLTPLVGRDDEVDLLIGRWERVKGGEGQVVFVSGEPGIGKSRLCETLRERVAGQVRATLTLQCSPLHTSSAFYPVIRQIEQAAGIEPRDGSSDRLDKLTNLADTTGNQAGPDLSILASLFSLPFADPIASVESGIAQSKEQLLRALTYVIVSQTEAGPALVVLEDFHWADPSTMELTSRLVEEAEHVPILILITSRSEINVGWKGLAHVSAVLLSRLDRAQCRQMLMDVAGPETPSEAVVSDILDRADGVPLFMEELTRSVIDGDDDGSMRQIPETLQDLLMSRLDQLPNGKAVAQTGAAIGREFARELVEAVSRMEPHTLRKGLDELQEAGLVARRGFGPLETYRFRHALIQDAAYDSLVRAARIPLHRSIAETISRSPDMPPEALAHHWEEAGVLDEALAQRLRAAERAIGKYAAWEAIDEYWAALRLLEELPETPESRQCLIQTILAAIGVSLVFWRSEGERRRALALFENAMHAALVLNDQGAWAQLAAYRGGLGHALEPGRDLHEENEALLARAVHAAAATGDRYVQAQVASEYGRLLGVFGRLKESLVQIEQAIDDFDALGLTEDAGRLLASQGRCFNARTGNLAESLEYAARVQSIVEETGSIQLRAWLAMAAEPYMYKGLWQQAADAIERHLQHAWEFGAWSVVLFCSAWGAIANMKLGDLETAHVLLDEALGTAVRRTGDTDDLYPQIYPRIARTELLLLKGETEQAVELATSTLAIAESFQGSLEHGATYRVLGQAHAAMGNQIDAEQHFRTSIEILQKTDSRPELAQSLLAHGKFMQPLRPQQGRRLLQDALTLFADMDATGWIEETRDTIDQAGC